MYLQPWLIVRASLDLVRLPYPLANGTHGSWGTWLVLTWLEPWQAPTCKFSGWSSPIHQVLENIQLKMLKQLIKFLTYGIIWRRLTLAGCRRRRGRWPGGCHPGGRGQTTRWSRPVGSCPAAPPKLNAVVHFLPSSASNHKILFVGQPRLSKPQPAKYILSKVSFWYCYALVHLI